MNLAALFPQFAFPGVPAFAARHAKQHRTSGQAGALPAPQQAPQHTLPRHATLKLPDRCATLQVLKGCVWVTRDGCPADWVLDAGQHFEQRPGAPVLVHALQDAELALVTTEGDAQNAR